MTFRWRCFLCPQRGAAQTFGDAEAAYWWHYRKRHRDAP